MKKLITYILIFGLTSIYLQGFACKCKTYIGSDRADLVFSGRVVNISEQSKWATVKFEISSSFKGNRHKKITIRTKSFRGSCGYHFVEGEEYLVYATKSMFRIAQVSGCSYTINITGKKQEEIKIEKGSQ